MAHDPEVLDFLEGRLAPTGLFVEVGDSAPTVEAMRFGLETMVGIGRQIGHDLRRNCATFLMECLRGDGGIAPRLAAAASELSSTYYAVRLVELGHVPAALLDRRRIGGWITDRLFDGAAIDRAADVDELYYGIRALQLMNAPELDKARVEGVVDYIAQCASLQGGFGPAPWAPPDIERTYCCVHVLQALDRLSDANVHASWIRRCVAEGQVYWDPSRKRRSPGTFYWGLRAAAITGAQLAWNEVAAAIDGFKKKDGGYGNEGGSQLWHTYCCVNARRIAAEKGLRNVEFA